MPLKIIRQNITKLKVDAIVNATNPSLVFSVSVRMACPSCKKRRPSSKAPASKNICDYISNA